MSSALKKPLRLLIYAGNFFPEKIGIGKYAGEMAEWMAKRGHQVEVITGFPYYPEWKLHSDYERMSFSTEVWNGVVVHRVPHYVPPISKIDSIRRMAVDASLVASSAVPWMKVLFRRTKPDIIVCMSPPLVAGLWPLLISQTRGIPWMYHVQDFQADAAIQLGMVRGKFLIRALLGIERLLLRKATAVSSITRAMCSRAIAKGASADAVIEVKNWSDTTSIVPSPRENSFRSELGLKPSQLLVMYAGAMGKKQGLELVLNAAKRLQEDERLFFVMVGSGSDADHLMAQAKDLNLHNIAFMPLQPKERMNEMLAAGDIHLVIQRAHAADLVMPSKMTNILASGRPMIATAEEGTEIWDVVRKGKTGLVTQPEDLEDFVGALLQLADNAKLRENFGHNARRFAEANLEQRVILSHLESNLYSLTTGGGVANPGVFLNSDVSGL